MSKEKKEDDGFNWKKNLTPFTSESSWWVKNPKWTEENVHKLLDDLTEWLTETKITYDEDGNPHEIDAGNVIYKVWLHRKKLYPSWKDHVCRRFPSVKERFEDIDKIQEVKLYYLSLGKEIDSNMTKFILSNIYNWSEKRKNENTNHFNPTELKDIIKFKGTDDDKK